MNASSPSYGLVTSVEEFESICQRITAEGKPFGFDIETSYEGETRTGAALHPEENFIAGFSITNALTWARYIPVRHDTGTNLDEHRCAELLWPVLNTGLGVAHGAKFEFRCLSKWFMRLLSGHPVLGEAVRATFGYFPIRSCTLLESYVEAANKTHGLKDITLANFGHKMAELLSLFPAGLTQREQKSIRFSVLDQHDPAVYCYACEDALWALRHHLVRYPRVCNSVIYKIEMAALMVFCEMEDTGVYCDWNFMRDGAARATAFADKLQAEITAELSRLTGTQVVINLNSAAQLAKVLYDELGMPQRRKSRKTGKPSTDKIALKGLSKQYPVVQKILNYKSLRKLTGTYLDKYPREYSYAPDGLTHPGHIQHGVPSGRIAVSDWPYQQSPKKYYYQLDTGEEFSFNFRDAVAAPPAGHPLYGCAPLPDPGTGWYILGFDLSQAELRALAGEARENALVEAFASGQDVHRKTAALMLGKQIADVTDADRAIGKAQPTYEQVLTPRGWRRMDSLRVGDFVIGSDGQPTEVTGIFPQGRKDIYEVRFSDGAAARCTDDHLWAVGSRNWSRSKTLPLVEIRKSLRWKHEYRYWVDTVHPVDFDDPGLPVDPYLLGLLLGDGSFRGRGVSFTTADEDLVEGMRRALEPMGLRLQHKEAYDYYVVGHGRKGRGSVGPLIKFLRDTGLWGAGSRDKFVPAPYLLGSSGSRLALLQGLLDTDGCALSGGAEFCTSSDRLADDVVTLARSLGGTARKSPHANSTAWRVYIRIRGIVPFRLKRKTDRYTPSDRPLRRKIVEVVPCCPALAQCISVAAPDGLYVTRDFVVTHNTLNFAIGYQMGVDGLADRLGITKDEAQDLFDQYFAAYPRIRKWTEQVVAQSKLDGFVTTRFGRRIRIWEYQSSERYIYNEGERLAGNAPIQGAATGDYVKLAMVRSRQALRRAGLADRVRLVMNIHDALEWYVRDDVPPAEVIGVLQPAVVFPVDGWPPMVADWHAGRRWGSVSDLELLPDGTVRVKKKGEPAPAAPPGDEDEEGAALPEVSAEALRAVTSGERAAEPQVAAFEQLTLPSVHDDGTPRAVVIRADGVPDTGSFQHLQDVLGRLPGPNSVTLSTPQGDVPLPGTCGLAPVHGPEISLLLGGAQVVYAPGSVDTAALTDGLVL